MKCLWSSSFPKKVTFSKSTEGTIQTQLVAGDIWIPRSRQRATGSMTGGLTGWTNE
jgi:hypothetical protein